MPDTDHAGHADILTAPRTFRQWAVRFTDNRQVLEYDDEQDAVEHARSWHSRGVACEVVYRVITRTRWISPKEDEDP